jgi:hypothetical protein
MSTRFGIQNVRSLYRASLPMTVVIELSKYKLELVKCIMSVGTEGGTKPASNYTFFYGKGTTFVVYWSEFLATDPEVRVRFPALPDFLRSSGFGMGSTQPP